MKYLRDFVIVVVGTTILSGALEALFGVEIGNYIFLAIGIIGAGYIGWAMWKVKQ